MTVSLSSRTTLIGVSASGKASAVSSPMDRKRAPARAESTPMDHRGVPVSAMRSRLWLALEMLPLFLH